MADFKDVMRARENATISNETLVSLTERMVENRELDAVAVLTAASAICLHIRSLECTLDRLGTGEENG